MILSALILASAGLVDTSRLPASAKEVVQIETRKETKTAARMRLSLNVVCQIYKDAVARTQDPKTRDNLPELRKYLEQRIRSDIKHESVKQIWRNLTVADPKDKQGFWELAASDLGVRGWTCSQIEQFHTYVDQN